MSCSTTAARPACSSGGAGIQDQCLVGRCDIGMSFDQRGISSPVTSQSIIFADQYVKWRAGLYSLQSTCSGIQRLMVAIQIVVKGKRAEHVTRMDPESCFRSSSQASPQSAADCACYQQELQRNRSN